jgi:hypothetical protein
MNEAPGAPVPPRPQWAKVSWIRVVIALGSIFAFLGAAAWFLFPWYQARWLGGMSPKLQMIPVDVPDKSISMLSQVLVTPPGYTFQIPSDEVIANANFHGGSSVQFKSGNSILALSPTDSGFVSVSRKSPDGKRRALIRAFGEEAMQSDYQFLADALEATPNQTRWWARTGNVKSSIFLEIKWMEIIDSKAVFRIGNSDFKGFEFLPSEAAPQVIKLKLFDKSDQLYEILLLQTGRERPIQQADINALVASMRPIPHS